MLKPGSEGFSGGCRRGERNGVMLVELNTQVRPQLLPWLCLRGLRPRLKLGQPRMHCREWRGRC